MKSNLKYFVLSLFIILLAGCATKNNYQKLDELYKHREYFKLRDELNNHTNDNSVQLLYYRGIVENLFGQYSKSVKTIEKYLTEGGKDDTSKAIECYTILATNYIKMHKYQKVADMYQFILDNYKSGLSEEKTGDYKNSIALFNLIKNVPAQQTVFNGDTKLEMKNHELPININENKISFPFDSGANFSIIIYSLAKKFGLEIPQGQINVESITGEKVKARMGVAKKLVFGNVQLSNVIFLVFDDEDMYIKPAKFQLRGLIGSPVIEALQELTIYKNGTVNIPQNPTPGSNLHNLCFDSFNPIIQGEYKREKLAFTFDTGADKSKLDLPFYKKFEKEIKGHYPTTKEKMMGIGSVKEFNAYEMSNVKINIGGKTAVFDKIKVIPEKNTSSTEYFYGNLGQDLINQFNSVTFNFRSMFIRFN